MRQNKEIIILPADKGNLTVVLSFEEYKEKALDLLNAPPFLKLKRDPTANTEKRVNDVVKKVAGKVEKDQAQTIAALKVPSKGTRPPLFYGALKIHKPGYPLRPIVSATGSATYKVSKYVSKILTPYATQLPSFVRNTAQFIEDIKEI